MIYLCDDRQHIPGDILRLTYSLMPPERRARADRYRFERDRDLCVLAYGLLMYGLRNEYGITDNPALLYGPAGKPYLADYPHIYFNLSHCRAGVACAVSRSEVGIDIQEIRPFDLDTARAVCTDGEQAQLAKSPSPDRLFIELWTVKESFSKRQGNGLALPFNLIDANEVFNNAKVKKIRRWCNGYYICCFGEEDIIRPYE